MDASHVTVFLSPSEKCPMRGTWVVKSRGGGVLDHYQRRYYSARTAKVKNHPLTHIHHTHAHSFQHTSRKNAFRTGLYVSPSLQPSLRRQR